MIKGTAIVISVKSSYGHVAFEGTVKESSLNLNMKSLINGNIFESLDFRKTDLK